VAQSGTKGPGPGWAGHEEQEEATPDDSFCDDGIKGPSGAAAREGEGAAVRRWRAGDGQHGRPASARIVEGHESKTRYCGARSDRKQDGTGVAGHARGWSLTPVAQGERENIATRDCISGVMRSRRPLGRGNAMEGTHLLSWAEREYEYSKRRFSSSSRRRRRRRRRQWRAGERATRHRCAATTGHHGMARHVSLRARGQPRASRVRAKLFFIIFYSRYAQHITLLSIAEPNTP